MKVKHLNDIHSEQVSAGTKTYRQVLIGPEEACNFAMRRFIIEPGGVEHEQFVLNGRARVGIGDDVFEVRKNDVVFIPVDMPHWYKALGDENFEFICVVPNKPDRVLLMEP
jgi:quercetin dioxygenase-like cupin family protein